MATLRGLDAMDAHIGIFDYRNLRHIDRMLSLTVLALACIGLAVLYSASGDMGTHYYAKQAAFLAMGAGVALFIVCLDHRFLVSLGPLLYVVAAGLLVAVLTVGASAKGGQRWLVVGPFRVQPSEQSKLVVILMLAWYLSTIGDRVRKLPYFLLAFVIAGVPAALILKQPNLGTALTLGPVAFVMLYVAGCKRWHLVVVVVVGLAAMPLAWSQLKDYQKDRLVAFRNPEADPLGTGWNVIQSKIAVGSGGLSGKGFGKSTQSRLHYLPEHHTDFIFSHLAEEGGFIGAAVTIGLYCIFLLRGLQLARDCPTLAGSLLAAGVVTVLGFHIFTNTAITMGLMPVTGLPLPFLSYGGSFYLTTMMCVGVLLNVGVKKGYFA